MAEVVACRLHSGEGRGDRLLADHGIVRCGIEHRDIGGQLRNPALMSRAREAAKNRSTAFTLEGWLIAILRSQPAV